MVINMVRSPVIIHSYTNSVQNMNMKSVNKYILNKWWRVTDIEFPCVFRQSRYSRIADLEVSLNSGSPGSPLDGNLVFSFYSIVSQSTVTSIMRQTGTPNTTDPSAALLPKSSRKRKKKGHQNEILASKEEEEELQTKLCLSKPFVLNLPGK